MANLRKLGTCFVIGIMVTGLLLGGASCKGGETTTPPSSHPDVRVIPQAQEAAMQTLSKDDLAFALDLYKQLGKQEKGNLFFSPYSLSIALAMTYAGASGETAAQMAKALHFSLPQPELHQAYHALSEKLQKAGRQSKCQLNIANALWGQKGYEFLPSFLKVTSRYYGGGLRQVDFGQPKQAVDTINKWVEDQTKQRIKNLLKPTDVNALTRLVLTNAIYFKGEWSKAFEPDDTSTAPFYLEPGKTVQVKLMYQKEHFPYYQGKGFQALELPYGKGDLVMLVLLPDKEKGLGFIEQQFTPEFVAQVEKGLEEREVEVWLPKFKLEQRFSLPPVLEALGMKDAFDPGKADLSGMDGTKNLYISDVLHKAFVKVDEQGTEAAASTAVVVAMKAMPIDRLPRFRADHPFAFAIMHKATHTVLFLGRLVKPEAV